MKIGEKIMQFTDLHLGLRMDEPRHNQECIDFMHWAVDQAQAFGAKTCIFTGDWHHSRNATQTTTLAASMTCMEILNAAFDAVVMIPGNHDLFYKDRRDYTSVAFCRKFDKFTLISNITPAGDCTLVPWLLSGEHTAMQHVTTPYVFGHFEVPNFLLNSKIVMPAREGHLEATDFTVKNQRIFSGHFHARQQQVNAHGSIIAYTGNAFPHNFSDVGDDARGIMLLELGQEPEYRSWPAAPRFRECLLSELIQDPLSWLDAYTTARIHIDINMTHQQALDIRHELIQNYAVRDIKLMHVTQEAEQSCQSVAPMVNMEAMIYNNIMSVDSAVINREILLGIYNNL